MQHICPNYAWRLDLNSTVRRYTMTFQTWSLLALLSMAWCKKCDDIIKIYITVQDSRSSSPSSSPNQGHCVVFLGKTLIKFSPSASLHPCIGWFPLSSTEASFVLLWPQSLLGCRPEEREKQHRAGTHAPSQYKKIFYREPLPRREGWFLTVSIPSTTGSMNIVTPPPPPLRSEIPNCPTLPLPLNSKIINPSSPLEFLISFFRPFGNPLECLQLLTNGKLALSPSA